MNYCPLCGAPDATVVPADRLLYHEDTATDRARVWRQHLADCPGGDEKRAVSVSIPFEVLKPISPDTNHVTYVNKALGLEYRFYYPDYLDRQKCAERIAKVEPYPERIDGVVIGELQKNELCAALMEWRALVIAKSTADFTYRAFQKLNQDYSRLVQSQWRNRFRRWWDRVWNGQPERARAGR